jgi:3-oxoacyl-[acyl-carrier protein] reductase
MSQELTGESAVVAAASKGIGPLIARKLGAERAAVGINSASSKAGAERCGDSRRHSGMTC